MSLAVSRSRGETATLLERYLMLTVGSLVTRLDDVEVHDAAAAPRGGAPPPTLTCAFFDR